MSSPRKITVLYREFHSEHTKLRALNEVNRQSKSVPAGTLGRIDNDQFYLLTEGVFFSIFRAYENSIEKIFLSYLMGERSSLGRKPFSYVSPSDYEHARELVKSGSNYIDWNNPSNLIRRSELYLSAGFIVKPAITTNQADLLEMVRLRNHVAHRSDESLDKYKSVLRYRLRTVPVTIPSVGEFLNMTLRGDSSSYHLKYYFSILLNIIYAMTH